MTATLQPTVVRRWRLDRPVDLPRTVGILRRGSADPTNRFIGGTFWRASRTPDGPGTVAVRVSSGELVGEAWGAGADWLLDSLPDLVGERDDWSTLDLRTRPVLHRVRRRLPGVRLCRTGLVMDALVPACLEQRVTGGEAWRAWRELVRAYSEPAPGPSEARMWLPPTPSALLAVTSWDWHRFGVDLARHRAIRAAASVADRLQECVRLGADGQFDAALGRLMVVPGIGRWTAAEVTLRALGDPDAVSVGDFHLKNLVGYALTGAARSDDDTMLALLEPWRGQRARVIRLIELSGLRPPKFGPHFHPNDIRVI
jgi:3-methyladenine DNA glycosylase/8-oxoguanine DNA glycosylase